MDWSQHLDEQTMGGMAFDLGPDGKPLVIHWGPSLLPALVSLRRRAC